MKIFLVNPIINQYLSYNYGLGYVAAVLKEGGHNVEYIILNIDRDVVEFYKKIQKNRPEIVAFSATTSQFNYLKDIINNIKQISNPFVICGGIHSTLKPDCIFEIPGLDAIVRGEGELPMRELADAFENQDDYWHIKNFWFKEKGETIKNKPRPLIRNLDTLPFPDKTSLEYQQIINKVGGINRFIFSRGCVFDCPYCSNKALMDFYSDKATYFRVKSPQKAIEEIRLDASKYKFDTIFFDDDIITLDKKWFYEFFRLYKSWFKYPFYCNVRPGIIDSDMVKLLKEAGATGVVVGLEHGNEKFRKNILKRNITNKEIIETFKLCAQYNIINNYAQIMVGLPFEDINLFTDTVRLCRKLSRGTAYYLYIFAPYPGTEFGKLCEKYNWLPNKVYYAERYKAVISYPKFKKEDIQICFDIFRFLVHCKFLPLNILFIHTIYLFKFYKITFTFFRRVLKKLITLS